MDGHTEITEALAAYAAANSGELPDDVAARLTLRSARSPFWSSCAPSPG